MGWFGKKDRRSHVRSSNSISRRNASREEPVPAATTATATAATRSATTPVQRQLPPTAPGGGGGVPAPPVVQQQSSIPVPTDTASRSASYETPNPSMQRERMTPEMQQQQQPSPAPQVEEGSIVDQPASDDDALMVIDRPPTNAKKTYDMEEQSGKSFSRDIEEEEREVSAVNEASRQNHLNSLFNGHLMKWKFEAEEGSAFIRVPAFFGALGLISTAIVALVTVPGAWTSHSIVMSVCVITMAVFIVILDGRFLATNPLSARAHLRNIMTRNFNIFRFLWGRGLLYMAAGILNVAQLWLITVISGGIMILIGIIALFVGVHASRKFAALRNSLADESFLLLVFSNYDADGDGYLAPNEFALLLADLGMELDDRYTLKAFNVIDTDNDRKVSFEEFSHWWASGYIERGRKRRDEEEDDLSYRRLD